MYLSRALILGVSLVLLLACPREAMCQVQWDKYPGNPVLPVGGAGEWDSTFAVANTVMFHEGTYKMWYKGVSGFGYATSPDGLTWTKHLSNPVLQPGGLFAWDQLWIDDASVLVVDGTYRMWYSGVDGSATFRIGHATSPDGIVWTKDPASPVLNLGPPGSWDYRGVFSPFVVYEDPLYRMWYTGDDLGDDGPTYRILYAHSTDGVTWTKFTDHPMLEPGPPGAWDESGLSSMCVLRTDTAYHMWYTGWNQGFEYLIGYATSPDGIVWVKDTVNSPVLGPSPVGWDDAYVLVPNVMEDGGQLVMWYQGSSDLTRGQTGYAVSATGSAVDQSTHEGRRVTLEQNYPNPFNPFTIIRYELTQAGRVTLRVYDANGALVKTLENRDRPGGRYENAWNGVSDHGGHVSSGVYFYRLTAGNRTLTKKMVLLK